MHIGLRLKQARLEAGLSQRQLCGDTITRNMLSLIENGSARPSMDTLAILAQRLGKPISYFLEEQTVTSPNQECMGRARNAPPEQIPEILSEYRTPDPVFDREYYLLIALGCMAQAEQAIVSHRLPYGMTLLEQAAKAGAMTPYYTPEIERRRLLLCYRCSPDRADKLAGKLPDITPELLLRAEAALQKGEPQRCAAILEAAEIRSERWHYLRAEAAYAQKKYQEAASHYLLCNESPEVFKRLELCYKEMGDYRKAYEYATGNFPK